MGVQSPPPASRPSYSRKPSSKSRDQLTNPGNPLSPHYTHISHITIWYSQQLTFPHHICAPRLSLSSRTSRSHYLKHRQARTSPWDFDSPSSAYSYILLVRLWLRAGLLDLGMEIGALIVRSTRSRRGTL